MSYLDVKASSQSVEIDGAQIAATQVVAQFTAATLEPALAAIRARVAAAEAEPVTAAIREAAGVDDMLVALAALGGN
jgi:hypothetical protein